ncbi:MAG: AMP-binding protein [Eubacteriales bacterium]|nr:AMP-binding protein [Eubacteriales bacterium]
MIILNSIYRNARLYPKQIAVRDKEQSFTHRQVAVLTHAIADLLKQRFTTGGRVILCLAHDAWMPLILYACLEAKLCYIPMKLGSSEQELETVAKLSDSDCLISTAVYSGFNRLSMQELIAVAEAALAADAGDELKPELPCYIKDDEIYILHTSGSTGVPKGVVVTYENLTYILRNMNRLCPCQQGDVYLLATPYTFDVSVSEIYGWIEHAAACYVDSLSQLDLYRNFADLLTAQRLSHIAMSPSTFYLLLKNLSPQDVPQINQYLKFCMIAGERFLPGIQKLWQKLGLSFRLFNLYGPTEATVYASYFELSKSEYLPDVPIGYPLDGVDFAIYGDEEEGELLILGEGLAKGYTDPDLTAKAFIEYRGQRAYRSGDIVSWSPKGELLYHGRRDSQIQRNGIRLELGEIEYRLQSIEAVKDARIYFNSDKIYAFIIAEERGRVAEIEAAVQRVLPKYMQPNALIFVDEYLLNRSNKVDFKKMLADWQAEAFAGPSAENLISEYASEPEFQRIAELIKDCQKIDIPTGQEDILQLGFDSLDLVNLAIRLEREFQITIDLEELYGHRSNEAIYLLVKSKQGSPVEPQAAVHVAQTDSLSPEAKLQIRRAILDFIRRDEVPVEHRYEAIHIQRAYLRLQFKSVLTLQIQLPCGIDRARDLLSELVRREAILRARFDAKSAAAYQAVAEGGAAGQPSTSSDSGKLYLEECPLQVEIPVYDASQPLAESEFAAIATELIFERRYLGDYLTAFLLQATGDSTQLYVAVDHSICDGASLTMLRKALTYLSEGLDYQALPYRDYCEAVVRQNSPELLSDYGQYFEAISENQFTIEQLLTSLPHAPIALRLAPVSELDSLEATIELSYYIAVNMARHFEVDSLIVRSLLNIRDVTGYRYASTIGDVHTGYNVSYRVGDDFSCFRERALEIISMLKDNALRPGYVLEVYPDEAEKIYPGMTEKYKELSLSAVNFLGNRLARDESDFVRETIDLQNRLNADHEGFFVTACRIEDHLTVVVSRPISLQDVQLGDRCLHCDFVECLDAGK